MTSADYVGSRRGRRPWPLPAALLVAAIAASACTSVESTPAETDAATSSVTVTVDDSVRPTSTDGSTVAADEPVVFHGEGSQDVEFPSGADRVVVHAVYSGPGAFSVGVVDQSGDPVESVAFALPDHPYDAMQLITTPLGEVSLLRVRTAGEWTIELLDDDQVPSVGDEFAGEGNAVVRYEGPGGSARIWSEATGVFRVRAADGRSVVPEVNGPYSGMEHVQAGPVLLDIRAFGSWRVSIDPSGAAALPTESAGRTIAAANAALVDRCFREWVGAQGLAAEQEISKDRWQTVVHDLLVACDTAQAAVEPLAARSPQDAPLRVLGDVLLAIVMLVAETASFVCDDPCEFSASTRATLMQFVPERHDVPEALYGYLADDPTAITTAVIPGLQIEG